MSSPRRATKSNQRKSPSSDEGPVQPRRNKQNIEKNQNGQERSHGILCGGGITSSMNVGDPRFGRTRLVHFIRLSSVGSFVVDAVKVSVTQSCPTLCDPVDCSPPGSSVHGILQARILEWVAISSSSGYS